MASKTVEIFLPTGYTGAVLKLATLGTATVVNGSGDTLTESGLAGRYTATVTATLAGDYRAIAYASTGTVVFVGRVRLVDAVGVYTVTDEAAATSGTVDAVTGNVGGNVVGSVNNVVGAVGSVVGNLGGNVVGNLQGSVAGSVANVTGNVGGNLTGNVGGTINGLTTQAKSDVAEAVPEGESGPTLDQIGTRVAQLILATPGTPLANDDQGRVPTTGRTTQYNGGIDG